MLDPLERFERARREPDGELAEPTAIVSPQDPDCLGDLEGIPHRVAERLRHVRHSRRGRSPPAPSKLEARAGEGLGVARRLHEGSGPGLHVEQDEVGLDGELLRHHAGRDQRDGGNRRGRVAQRVEGAVGRDESRRLCGDGAAHALDLTLKLVGR